MMTQTGSKIAIVSMVVMLSACLAIGQTNTFPASGDVGIGTTSPKSILDIEGGSLTLGSGVIHLPGGGDGTSPPIHFTSFAPATYSPGGNLGIWLNSGGFISTNAGLQVGTGNGKIWTPGVYNFEGIYLGQYGNGDNALEFLNHTSYPDSYGVKLETNIDSGVAGLQIQVAQPAASYQSLAYSTAMTIVDSGNVGIGTTSPAATLEVNGNVKLTGGSGASLTFADGTVQSTAFTGVLCGGDFAESVDVTGKRAVYEPGDVLVIDPKAPGKFAKSGKRYSTAVLGIYSTKPGVVGRRLTTPKSADEVPLAMVGIVPTKVSAENGPIRPGDLLVTASIRGYAMKGTDRSRMLGAVSSKALGSLDRGKGTSEVGVTQQ